ncbi:MAG: VCBS repeat-containing protein [Phycisphaeraceae bacterium]
MVLRLLSGLPVPALLAGVLLHLIAASVAALVDPSLQPADLYQRYEAVIVAEVIAIDDDARQIELRLTERIKGEHAADAVTLEVPGGGGRFSDTLLDVINPDQPLVALIGTGTGRRSRPNKLLLYAGKSWHLSRRVADDPGRWVWEEDLGDRMYGTFNGAEGQLVTLMRDLAAGRYYFPADPHVRFRSELVLGTFEAPVRGVALYDLDGDGHLDVYACSEAGDRLYLQNGELQFEDRTEAMGLAGLASRSVGVADVDGDGRADLLLDAAIYRNTGEGFERTGWLPEAVGEGLIAAAFVEIDGDGRPDVVISRRSRGLSVYRNPAAPGRSFADITAELGLDRPGLGGSTSGYFAPGDFDGDGRTDLYLGAGTGLILVQREPGRFATLEHDGQFQFTGDQTQTPQTGAGGFAPLWAPDRMDLVAACQSHLVLLSHRDGQGMSVAGYGNEIQQMTSDQLATLPADLNADGTVDLFTLSREPGTANIFHANRGYGSFMAPENYLTYDAFPGEGYDRGAAGAAAGDVDGDGAEDLLLAGADGVLRLWMNGALEHREAGEAATTQQRTLARTALLNIRLDRPRGVVGATVRLERGDEVVALRPVGTTVLTGCRGPDAVSLAVREPGEHRLIVRYADGHERSVTLTLESGGRHAISDAELAESQ